MKRILISLSLLSLLVVAAALCLGLSVGDLYQTPRPSDGTLRLATIHRLTGTAASLAVVFVECIIVTYFIGTSRWCREVVETYDLDPELAESGQRLKRKAFPWALSGMLVVVGIGALGAAGDPATGREGTSFWSQVHLFAALGGFAFIAWTYFSAWNHVVENQALIEKIVGEVARVRQQRGLERGIENESAEVSAENMTSA